MAQPINMREGVIWACRLLLNRDPANDNEIEAITAKCRGPDDLLSYIRHLEEYKSKFENAGRAPTHSSCSVDLREGIIWGYRLIFGQEPDDDQIKYQLSLVHDIAGVRQIFILSREFEIQNGYGAAELLDFEIINRFAPFCDTPAPSDFSTTSWYKDPSELPAGSLCVQVRFRRRRTQQQQKGHPRDGRMGRRPTVCLRSSRSHRCNRTWRRLGALARRHCGCRAKDRNPGHQSGRRRRLS